MHMAPYLLAPPVRSRTAAQGWSLAYLARLIHVSPSTLGDYLSARRQVTLRSLVRIAQALHLDPMSLVEWRPARIKRGPWATPPKGETPQPSPAPPPTSDP